MRGGRSTPLILWAAVLAGCGGEEAPPEPEPGFPVVHAPARDSAPQRHGELACGDCHGQLVDDWSHTGMARSLGRVEPGELDGLGAVPDGDSGYVYRFARSPDGEGFVIGETRPDRPEYGLGSVLALGIGSGERDRSYAAVHGRGLWFAPLEVLTTAAGRHAALAPGAMMQSGTRLTQAITPECLGCHTNAPPPRDYPLNLLPGATWEPRGIGCAACHGRDAAHAAWQERSLAGEEVAGEDPILRHRELDRWAQLSVCAACHLQGDARLVLDEEALGPPPPGGDLLEQRALFVAAEPNEEVGFVSHVERLVLSRCFTRSEMTCTTCHDPHRTLHEPRERRRVRDACTRCHPGEGGGLVARGGPSASACSRDMERAIETHHVRQDGAPRRDCVSCHMPRTGVFDVAEVMIHDHFVRTDTSDAPGAYGPEGIRFPESAEGDWRRFTWPAGPAPSHLDDPGLWMMAYASGKHLDKALAKLDETPGPTAAGLPMYHHVRGSLLESVGREEAAAAAYERALELDPLLAPSAINLGLLLGQLGRADEGMARLDAVIERHPFADGALRNRAVLRHGAGDLEGFVEDLTRAFEANPRATLAASLAEVFAAQGAQDRAAHWRGIAGRLDPVRHGAPGAPVGDG